MNDRRYTPSLRATLRAWREFTGFVQQRLRNGARAYGNKSFSRDPEELLHELQDECLDLAAWGYILFTRLKRAERALRDARRDDPFFPSFRDD